MRVNDNDNSNNGVEIKVHTPSRGETAVHPTASSPARPPVSGGVVIGGWVSWLVPLVVVANIAVFVAIMYVNDCPKSSGSCVAKFLGRFSFQPMKENPLLGPSSSTLEKMGALDVDKVVNAHQGWRLITCIWLHAGVFHLLANMLSLLFIGIRLEQEFGFIRVGLVYVLSGFGGSLLSALFLMSRISVGASGALFGLLGAMLSEMITNWTLYANKFVALSTLLFIILVNLAVGLLPHVDSFAHIGGFLSGFFLGFVLLVRPQFQWLNRKAFPPGYIARRVKSRHNIYQYVLWIASLILLVFGFTAGLIVLLRGVNVNDYCPWCHYLACIPTSLWSCKPKEVYCQSSQLGNHLNLTCLSNGRSRIYYLADSSDVQRLCTQLCS